jgi:phenylacetate-coenzyme A ligase PaaK-like adenylate-forming protein
MLLFDDHAIVEPVDERGRPVSPGDRAAMLYVTPLFRHTLPMLRYQLTDELTVCDEPASCGAGFRRISHVAGRLDDQFSYTGAQVGEIAVHPHVFRSVLSRERGVLEYQVRQTTSGADIAVTSNGVLDTALIAQEIASDLTQLGLTGAQVGVFEVPRIERIDDSTKLKRFIPLKPGSRRGAPRC